MATRPEIGPEQIKDLFTNRPPNAHQAEILDQITETMIEAATELVQLLPDSRFRALALTKIEEASMWAKKAAVFTVE
jgi:hypothetical protein